MTIPQPSSTATSPLQSHGDFFSFLYTEHKAQAKFTLEAEGIPHSTYSSD